MCGVVLVAAMVSLLVAGAYHTGTAAVYLSQRFLANMFLTDYDYGGPQ